MTDLYERDARVLSRLQKLRFFPLAIVGGKGPYLTNQDGRQLLDLSASWGAASLGHSHPALVEAVTKAIANQAGASVLSSTNEAVVTLAERLLEQVPGPNERPGPGDRDDRRVWFGHSGSDANETVARAVVAATGRPRIISFTGAYHGGTAGSMAVSAHSVQTHAEKAEGLVSLTYPDPYRLGDRDQDGAAILRTLQKPLRDRCLTDRGRRFVYRTNPVGWRSDRAPIRLHEKPMRPVPATRHPGGQR